ncbi:MULTISPECIES: hypothetical protein [Pseudescherichia]|uniref:hypothetical protein n=1 Tax=Pseudescherichia TaxID=2055880 RepID=UPI0028AEEA03|nr:MULTISPECIES: hypothetical protein [Pseudescherichia]
MQIDKKTLNSLLETLNSIICEDNLLTYDQRENMVKTVATVGSLIERTNGNTVKPEAPKKVKKYRMPRSSDPRFPNAGKTWSDNEDQVIQDIIEELPDDAIGDHVIWISEKLGRTPYSVACRIVTLGRCSAEWTKPYKALTDRLRGEPGTDESISAKN